VDQPSQLLRHTAAAGRFAAQAEDVAPRLLGRCVAGRCAVPTGPLAVEILATLGRMFSPACLDNRMLIL
jgi:hypothetical protein